MKKIKYQLSISENIITKKDLTILNECLLDNEKIKEEIYLQDFEKNFAKYNKAKYGVAVGSEIEAFHLILTVMKIKSSDEIILPDLTPINSVFAISYLGAKPVFVDVEAESWNIDINKIEANITEKTKAIIAVHLYGQPANVKELQRLCQKYNLSLIEDCTYALGAELASDKVGSTGIASCFSLNKNSILNCGGGAVILTNNSRIYEQLIFLRNKSQSEKVKYFYSEVGFDYKLSIIHSIIGLIKLKQIDEIIEKKKKLEEVYLKELNKLTEINFQVSLMDRKKVNPFFSILYKHNKKRNKDAFIKYLNNNNIEAEPFIIPITELPMYYSSQKLNNNARIISNEGINIPMTSSLRNEEQNYIIEKLEEFFRK